MKTITHISWLIALFASLQITASHAQTSYEPITQQITLHVERAGTLPLMIDDIQKYLITNLKLSGELNGTDILMLREMASGWHLLEKLDLSDAEIIEGASPYFESAGTSYTTSTWTISPYMFYNCNLKSIKLPKTTKKICQYAFSGCKQLSDIEIPEGVTEILGPAFRDCSSLTNVNIAEGVTDMSYAFQNCVALKTIDIPKSVTNLSRAFKNCYSLTNVNIPEGVMYMSGAFECCYDITNVNIPKSVTNLSEAFIGCDLTNVNIPEGVTNLSYAFQDCTKLTHVNIPKSVTNMSYAFRNCSILTHVDIPEGVTDLSYTFSGCTNLTSVNILGESPLPLNEYGFKNTFKIVSIYKPSAFSLQLRSFLTFTRELVTTSLSTFRKAQCLHIQQHDGATITL